MNLPIHNFAWIDTQVFQNRYEKSTCALVAIRRVLAKNNILNGQEKEFLCIYDSLAEIDSKPFTLVWSDPTAYYWTTIAYELLKSYLTNTSLSSFAQNYCDAIGKQDSSQALIYHLSQFKKFAIAFHYLAGTDCLFEEAFIPNLPLAIAGTNLFLEGKKSIKIHGLVKGKLKVSYQDKEGWLELASGKSWQNESLQVKECPIVTHQDCQIKLQSSTFNLLGVEDGKSVVKAGIDFQKQHSVVVKEALTLLENYHPRTFGQIRDFLQIIAFKPKQASTYNNLSHSDLPGSLICSSVKNAYELADTLIHEFHHNRLFFIEEFSSLLMDTDSQNNQEIYYSPWRNDLRPIKGLFHAVYVYISVCEFWLSIYQQNKVSPRELEFASSELMHNLMRLKIGVIQLEKYANFTQLGNEFFKELQTNISSLDTIISQLPLSINIPIVMSDEDSTLVNQYHKSNDKQATVKDFILYHLNSFDINKQCENIGKELLKQ